MLATTLHLYSQTPLWSSARAVFKSASLMILQRRRQRGPGGGCPLQKNCPPPWATAWEAYYLSFVQIVSALLRGNWHWQDFN